MENINIGVEIESVVNSKIHNINRGGYHEGYPVDNLPGWVAESDNSIHRQNDFDGWEDCIEFVSGIFEGKKQFINGLKKFKKFFSKNGKYELNEVLSFNESCGSHIHLSIEDFSFNKKVIFEVFPKARKYFINHIRKSKIENKGAIINHYNRYYAKEINKENWKNERYSEFNFYSEIEEKGFEWRSINMRGIQTWKEFFEFWRIVYKSVEYLIKISNNYSKVNYKRLVEKNDIKEMKEFIKNNKKQKIIVNVPKRRKSYSRIKAKVNFFEGEEIKCAI